MIKQVWDLTPADLESNAIWVFPMDESVEDEASVRPVRDGELASDRIQLIARAIFRDQGGRLLPGYIYPGCGSGVEDTQPVAWSDSLCITFWNGFIKPSPDYVKEIRCAGLQWPLSYEIDADGVKPQHGSLDGIYYLEGNVVRCLDCR